MNRNQETAGRAYAVHQLIAAAIADPASVTDGQLPLPHDPVTGLTPDPAADGTWLAAAALAALDAAGYAVVPAPVPLYRLRDCEILKALDDDFYIAWSGDAGEMLAAGTRAQMLEEGCPEQWLCSADNEGTSGCHPCCGCWSEERIWTPDGPVLRENLIVYARARLAGDLDAVRALLLEQPGGNACAGPGDRP